MAPKPTPLVPKPQAQRYRRGKLPNGAPIPSDDSSDDEEAQQQPTRGARRNYAEDERQGLVAGGAGKIIQTGSGPVSSVKAGSGTGKRNIQVALRDVKVEDDGALLIGGKREVGRTEMEVSSEEEEEEEGDEEDEKPPRAPAATDRPTAAATGGIKEESSEYETDSEEESSEEEPPKPVYRPTFVPKRARETVLVKQADVQADEELWKKKEEEAKARKKESRNLVGESIRRELAEKEATENVPDVDDTDDLDPEAEFEAWRLRELSRLTRDKEASLQREEEKEEIERRRAMPEAQRLREDEEHARKTREEKEANRGERGFLEKFYHKGAFYQDEDILKRNYNVKTESAVDVSLLPKAMQVRNYGKASRSKYTHLKDQDTTQGGWDRALRRGPESGVGTTGEGCFNCGGPHLRRDCPNTDGPRTDGPSASGTNTSNLSGQRAWGAPAGGPERNDRERREPYSDTRSGRDRDPPPRESGSKRDDADGHRDRERYGRERDRDYDRDKGRSYDDGRDRARSHGERGQKARRTSRSRSPAASHRRDDYRDRDRDRERDYRR